MKKLISVLAISFFYIVVKAQDIPTEQRSKTESAPVKEKKTTPTKISSHQSQEVRILKIFADTDCTVYVDGKVRAGATASKMAKISLTKGSYSIEVVGTNPVDKFSQKYVVDSAGTDVITINLLPIITARIEKENAHNRAKRDSLIEKQKQIIANIPIVFVVGGSFNMGSHDELDYNAHPVHPVAVSDFYIGKYEVSQALWRAIMGSNKSTFKLCDDCPVESVNWDDVQEFIKKINEITGKNYRLPTEAEWEYAARGGNYSKNFIYSGSNKPFDVAWYRENSAGKTQGVGQKNENELKIYDMSGNVKEWCQDWYGNYSQSQSPSQDPKGPSSGTVRVVRGGGWYGTQTDCHVAARGSDPPEVRSSELGFRLALSR